ncbi:MAG: class I SAM-dependent methyltransferase, partial [Desulfuromonadaceae bacterium]
MHSLGIDRRWRAFAVGKLHLPEGGKVLDVATGTGDVALEIAARSPASPAIVGADLTPGMLRIGQQKIARSPIRDRIHLVTAPCESMPHNADRYDVVT